MYIWLLHSEKCTALITRWIETVRVQKKDKFLKTQGKAKNNWWFLLFYSYFIRTHSWQYVNIFCILLVWHSMKCVPAEKSHRRTDTGTEGRWSTHSAKIKEQHKWRKWRDGCKWSSFKSPNVKISKQSCLWGNCAPSLSGPKEVGLPKREGGKNSWQGTACCGSRPHRSSRPWIQENVAQGIHKPNNLSETLKNLVLCSSSFVGNFQKVIKSCEPPEYTTICLVPCRRSTELAQQSWCSSSGREQAASSSGAWTSVSHSHCFWLPVGLLYPWCLKEENSLLTRT